MLACYQIRFVGTLRDRFPDVPRIAAMYFVVATVDVDLLGCFTL
jgi:hypothetical protein